MAQGFTFLLYFWDFGKYVDKVVLFWRMEGEGVR